MNKIACSRCGRRTKSAKAVGWNVTMRGGIPAGYLCPGCQSPEENAEAEINDSMTRYGRDSFGRAIGFPKFEGEYS